MLSLTHSTQVDASAFDVPSAQHRLRVVLQNVFVLAELFVGKPFRIFVLKKIKRKSYFCDSHSTTMTFTFNLNSFVMRVNASATSQSQQLRNRKR